jgi:SulP family sulfate permease
LIGFRVRIETKKTVADIASMRWSSFHIPDITLSFETLKIIFPYAHGFGRINRGLLTINLVDEITGTRGTVIENVLPRKCQYFKWFFFGMGGCPMIAQTLVNLLRVLEHVCQVVMLH